MREEGVQISCVWTPWFRSCHAHDVMSETTTNQDRIRLPLLFSSIPGGLPDWPHFVQCMLQIIEEEEWNSDTLCSQDMLNLFLSACVILPLI
ncbi:hypothetical protein PIB30_076157 [Stylosanthes scabra]|uniref:Uncharacterized protein n=1 Tax=Stylosanthes scabra TaxID=79078 RepID=A0ABU6XQJ0_9FABA|nr:hypothetical protein [Stylosanthes scabra]